MFWNRENLPFHREIPADPVREFFNTLFDIGFMRLAYGPER
jgi:hypothetical protein